MSYVLPLTGLAAVDSAVAGGKGWALHRMSVAGFAVPNTLCLTTRAYLEFARTTGLGERIHLELSRKPFADMRWEEMWDAAQRIRSMFLRVDIPESLSAPLLEAVHDHFRCAPVAVRSSAPGEDSAKGSFAGLHESLINVTGAGELLKAVRLVWASLWSDGALLYRQKIGLGTERASMAVLIQEMVVGARSGVAFSMSPLDQGQSVIEAVHGLNQGLVDGTIAPDRWLLDRSSGRVLRHEPAERTARIVPAQEGTRTESLPETQAAVPPLEPLEVRTVFAAAMELETLFGAPQDVEWTFADKRLVVLQSRPVTTRGADPEEQQRLWHLSLKRSLADLQRLRSLIIEERIPKMIADAVELASVELSALNDAELATEIGHRNRLREHWTRIYWEEFIPFAHGVRLFGRFYNESFPADDPYEFMDLLVGEQLESTRRNLMLEELADMLREDPALDRAFAEGGFPTSDPRFNGKVDQFMRSFGDLSCPMSASGSCSPDLSVFTPLLLQMSRRPPRAKTHGPGRVEAEKRFLARFQDPQQQRQAAELLALARDSHRLRDNDNIYLGRIEGHHRAAVLEGDRRLRNPSGNNAPDPQLTQAVAANAGVLELGGIRSGPRPGLVRVRQLQGHPAGPGLFTGRARVIHSHQELAGFRAGEILVCDSIDPNMTFVIPLASAIVERRGGMLVHGAIIAREYGLPCVTGIPEATEIIATGDRVTVDGHTGLVTIHGQEDNGSAVDEEGAPLLPVDAG
jgi:phosphohistidine swiveling domain-containing protein